MIVNDPWRNSLTHWQKYRKGTSIQQAPVFGTSEHYEIAHGSLLSRWMNYNYTACCWFPTSSNVLIHPSQFWQIRFESCWLHCSKCRILVLLRYKLNLDKLFNIVEARFEKKLWTLISVLYDELMMFRWSNKEPGIQTFWNFCGHYQEINYDWISPLNKPSGL